MSRWLALAVLAGAQLLIVLDATIVNVALSAIQADLGLAAADLQWVITGYVLAFGGFLLLGGRVADRFGRRRLFVAGTIGFAVGSVVAGLAQSAAVLLGGRMLQGLAAAVLAPAALSLVMIVFPEGRDRHRALGVWGAVSASGTAIGLIAGGVLTEHLSWQSVFWFSAAVAALLAACAGFVLPERRAARSEPFDVAGAVLGTAGLLALVYGLVEVPQGGSSPGIALVAAVVLLGGFAWLQTRRAHALVPIRLLRDRTVLGGNLVGLLLGAAIYALFYFLSLFMGGMRGYGAIEIGLSFLPMTVAIAAASALATRWLGRVGHRPLLVASALLVTASLLVLTGIDPDSGYAGTLLPAFLLAGLGVGLAFVALTSAAVGSAPEADSGIAAALFNTGQQVGGAIGLALLTSVSTTSATDPGAVAAGWGEAFAVAAALMAAGLAVVVTMMRAPVPR